ncbi:multiple epidermal growth factor-like domains protein 6 [Ostrea edulis]|uniref:multiple epidermal growth factor-like domains protein 6 n=1 Tax=Ostrea edulis TaxID=37623 RepID=UPI0024AEB712|nr:multiple epidermal growth factor-like domains protein 6 [Ostrea edulis]
MNVHIVNVLWLLSYSYPCVSALVCKGLKGLICCSGFTGHVWNETVHNCTRCMSGFHGENCASSCPFPYYGIRCGSKCNCSEDECHHQYGCKRSFGDCDPGIYGRYCELTCRYPGFGKDCQMQCECEEQKCNPITGCILDSSSPAAGPLASTTTAYMYPLNTVNENFNSSSPVAGPLAKTTTAYPLNAVNENFSKASY